MIDEWQQLPGLRLAFHIPAELRQHQSDPRSGVQYRSANTRRRRELQHIRTGRTQKTASGSPIRGIELLPQGPDNSGSNKNPEELTWPTPRARQPEVLSEL